MNFKTRMWALPGMAAVVLGLGLGLNVAMGERAGQALQRLSGVSYPLLEQVLKVDRALDGVQAALQAASAEGNPDKLQDSQAHAEAARRARAEAHRLAGGPALRPLEEALLAYHAVALEVTKAMLFGTAAPERVAAMQQARSALRDELARQEAAARAAVQAGSQAVEQARRQSLWAMAAMVALALLAMGLAARAIVASVWRDLGAEPSALRELVQRVADGDLSVPVEAQASPRSVRAALGRMTLQLRGTVGDIRRGSEAICDASAEIAAGNQDLSQRTEHTASSLQQAASRLSLLTGTVQDSAQAAQQARLLAEATAGAAQRGGRIVAEVVDSMARIQQASGRIADINSVIDGIAFQTNILALNAAVEAARAGEQGRGFAVVAGEVRTLAQRSAQAAREIKSLIGASGDTVALGTRLVGEAGQAMAEITQGVGRVSEIIAGISEATHQQSSGIVEVDQAVSALDHMTQQNAALVQQSAAAADSMRQQSDELVRAVALFRLEGAAA
ncbi:MAG: methyl-accepting chemotaxis protein [Aquincola tertiaricarbonis]